MGVIEPYQGKYSSLLLFGPPGAGKGMLGTFLSTSGSQYHLSSKQIFRKLASDSPAGKLFTSYASRGELLPDEATIEIWNYYVQGLIAVGEYDPNRQDLVLDGLPRTVPQAKMLEELITVRHVIVLEATDEEALLKRMQRQARQEGLFEEIDPEHLKTRLEAYQKESAALLELYPKHLISRVNAEQRPLEVLRDVLVKLSHVLSRGPSYFDNLDR